MAERLTDLEQHALRRLATGPALPRVPAAPAGIAGEPLVVTEHGAWALLLQCGAWNERTAPARLAQLQEACRTLDRPEARSAAQVLLARRHAGRWTLFELPLVPQRLRRPGARYWLEAMPGPGDERARWVDGESPAPGGWHRPAREVSR